MPEGQTGREGMSTLGVIFCLGCPWSHWLPENAPPLPDHGLFKGEDNRFDFFWSPYTKKGCAGGTQPLVQGPSSTTKETSPSLHLCVPQNQWHLEYWRFPVVKDLLMQRLPLSAREKQKARETGGLGGSHGDKCPGVRGLAGAHVHTRDG